MCFDNREMCKNMSLCDVGTEEMDELWQLKRGDISQGLYRPWKSSLAEGAAAKRDHSSLRVVKNIVFNRIYGLC